ncbi:MAG: hypothetical protein AAF430_17885 [Myxococcota bacterium]
MSLGARIAAGLWLGVLGAVFFFVGEFFLADETLLIDPSRDPDAFVAMVTSRDFAFFAGRGLVGIALEVVGAFALYLYLAPTRSEAWAFWGFLLATLGDLFGAGSFALLYVALPGIGAVAQTEGPAMLGAVQGGEFLFVLNGVLTLLGLVCFAVAIARSDRLPTASGLCVLLGFLLVPVPVFAIQLLANALWGVGAVWMAWVATRNRGATPSAAAI